MYETPPDTKRAFRALEQRLAARRLAALDLRGRVVMGLLGANLAGFAYWQAHGPLAGVVRTHGAGRGALVLAAALGGLALLGGIATAWRRVALALRPPGPEWLALPVPSEHVVGHLLSEARWVGALAWVPAAGVLAASASSIPAHWVAGLALAFVPAWMAATHAGAAIAWRAALPARRGAASLPASTRALLAAARAVDVRALPSPRWRRLPAWRAVLALDVLVTFRRSDARSRFAGVALLALLGLGAWFAPAPALTRRALAFLGFAPACAALGAWAILRTCSDPPSAMRPLPLGLGAVWRARATAVIGVVFVLAFVHAAMAGGFPWPARVGQWLAWSIPGATIALLGLHYALTLAPRATVAEGLYTAWLALALIASLMVPLLGWGVLIGGLVHSSLRLRRWWRPEVT